MINLQKKSLMYYNKITILATLTAMFCYLLDIALSLFAYAQNPTFFIEHESNPELVSFLTTGSFPFIMLLLPFGFIFLHFMNRHFVSKFSETKHGIFINKLFIINMLLLAITRLSGGLTWYFEALRGYFISHLQMVGFALLFVYFTIVIECAVEKEKKKVKTLKLA